jgi:hypothetical protein
MSIDLPGAICHPGNSTANVLVSPVAFVSVMPGPPHVGRISAAGSKKAKGEKRLWLIAPSAYPQSVFEVADTSASPSVLEDCRQYDLSMVEEAPDAAKLRRGDGPGTLAEGDQGTESITFVACTKERVYVGTKLGRVQIWGPGFESLLFEHTFSGT